MTPDRSPTDGLLLVDKPSGMTSHDVVAIVRKAYRERSIGHLGTLDPFATGLLVLLLGRCTRLATFIENEPKVYRATIQFGSETETDDLTGETIRTAGVPSLESITQVIPNLTGIVAQIPPAYSAKKIDGTRAYDMARRGDEVELKPVDVDVHAWGVHSFDPAGQLDVTITCGGGTYIRALARDLGRLTDSAAHLTTLRRLQSGPFHVDQATPLGAIREGKGPSVTTLRVVTAS